MVNEVDSILLLFALVFKFVDGTIEVHYQQVFLYCVLKYNIN